MKKIEYLENVPKADIDTAQKLMSRLDAITAHLKSKFYLFYNSIYKDLKTYDSDFFFKWVDQCILPYGPLLFYVNNSVKETQNEWFRYIGPSASEMNELYTYGIWELSKSVYRFDENLLKSYLPSLVKSLKNAGVTVKGCEKCKEVVCPKCKADTRHSQHSESILQIKDFIDMTLKQIGVFKSKFEGFVNENSRNYPIDADSIKEFISKQKKIVAKITNDEMKHIQSQFELFHKQIDILKQIEIENANSYHSFFLSKISSFEQSVIDLNNEINRIKQSLSKQIDYLTNFSLLSPNKKSDLIRDIPLSKELLREDKKTITNKIKEYHSLYSHISKTKKYYYRMVNNKNESKPYQFIKALIKLNSQMNSIYLTQNINDLLSQVIIENDNFSLINSRNYLT